jgi:kynurenine formamidase
MKVVDLTMTISPEIKVFPGSPQPSFLAWSNYDVHGYESEVMYMSTHTGTHMDAPSHFKAGGKSVEMINPGRFVASAVMLRIPKKANETITVPDLKGHKIRKGDTVVMATGWEQQNQNYMTENPGLSDKAADYLVEIGVNAVCVDGPSIDPGFDSKFSAHNILLPAGVIVVENLCNLASIAEKRFTLVIAPLKLSGASGSPVRALALL